LLSGDSYLLEGLQSADKKRIQKQSYITHPLFRKRKPLLCLFTCGNKNKNLFLPTE